MTSPRACHQDKVLKSFLFYGPALSYLGCVTLPLHFLLIHSTHVLAATSSNGLFIAIGVLKFLVVQDFVFAQNL